MFDTNLFRLCVGQMPFRYINLLVLTILTSKRLKFYKFAKPLIRNTHCVHFDISHDNLTEQSLQPILLTKSHIFFFFGKIVYFVIKNM